MRMLPTEFVIDVVGACNLKCVLCSQAQSLNEQPRKVMTLEDFKRITESFIEIAKTLVLYNWGEPFLNPELLDIVKYAKSMPCDKRVYLSTNGNLFNATMAEELVRSQADCLLISLSGVSNELYQRYHRGGDVNKVFQSIKLIAQAKKRLGQPRPRVAINYLRFPYNYLHADDLRAKLLTVLGDYELVAQVEEVLVTNAYVPGTAGNRKRMMAACGVRPEDYPNRVSLYSTCTRANNSPAIRADGTVFPCCVVAYRPEYQLGNLWENTLEEIWNSDRYQRFRLEFDRGTNKLCNDCYSYYPNHPVRFDGHFLSSLRTNLHFQTGKAIDRLPLPVNARRKWTMQLRPVLARVGFI